MGGAMSFWTARGDMSFWIARDSDNYASIHSNPPGPLKKHPGMTINDYGKGKCIYIYSALLALQNNTQQFFGEALFKKYINSSIKTNAPANVEITLLESMEEKTFLLCLVNYQHDLPNIPVFDLKISINLSQGKTPKICRKVSDSKEIHYVMVGPEMEFEIPCLETMEMIEISF
ncbi:hypothetical protein SMSP2_01347 [Limihaloglobus sulfuriphilus]|uniref:Uncharacterized protein n=1 Tax=Limihaloglobus sulfuriphilus TaxID=1851148 RepID=A0A1Q2ME49_9BACT|nr:hypothetical protein [Limihaloglobus sulfuriphilus]AQQ70983.1 hypothetical protein SMSP2_01347 [Limihaloglobus sulfuriphilus]